MRQGAGRPSTGSTGTTVSIFLGLDSEVTLLNKECYSNTFRDARLHVPVEHPKGC